MTSRRLAATAKQRLYTLVAVAAAATLGTALIFYSSAASFVEHAEAESGRLAGAVRVDDQLASGGAAVRFAAAASPAPTPPATQPGSGGAPSPAVGRGFMTAPVGEVTPQMFNDMRNTWDADIVRLQLFPVDLAKSIGKPLPDAWPAILDKLDQAVAAANAAGIKVVVDMHQAPFPGGVGGGGERSVSLWNSPDLNKNFTDAWTSIAQKLKPRQAGIWGFDLFNEPEADGYYPNAPPHWHDLAASLAATIHGITPDVWIVFDPGPNAQPEGYRNLTPLADKKVIYTLHDYLPHEFTHQSLPGWPASSGYPYNGYGKAQRYAALQPVVDFQNKYHVPIYVGEFSVIRWAPKADAVAWLNDGISFYEAHGWSWTYHAFREWDGWSLEHDENRSNTMPVNYVTDRGQVVMQAMKKNGS